MLAGAADLPHVLRCDYVCLAVSCCLKQHQLLRLIGPSAVPSDGLKRLQKPDLYCFSWLFLKVKPLLAPFCMTIRGVGMAFPGCWSQSVGFQQGRTQVVQLMHTSSLLLCLPACASRQCTFAGMCIVWMHVRLNQALQILGCCRQIQVFHHCRLRHDEQQAVAMCTVPMPNCQLSCQKRCWHAGL